MAVDKIYREKEIAEDFIFNHVVSEVFDDMVVRSVPHYMNIQNIIVNFVKQTIPDPCNIFDLGCSTGTTLILLDREMQDKPVGLIGIDNSEALLEKAREKMQKHVKDEHRIRLINEDIRNINEFENAGCIISNLTMQFIRPIHRKQIVTKIYNSLKPGGIFVLFEKMVEEHSFFNRNFINMYYEFKKSNNYTEMEIAKKREELENVLIPFTEQENHALLRSAGFENTCTLFKYINFGVVLAVK